jgi:hypothetical protein
MTDGTVGKHSQSKHSDQNFEVSPDNQDTESKGGSTERTIEMDDKAQSS